MVVARPVTLAEALARQQPLDHDAGGRPRGPHASDERQPVRMLQRRDAAHADDALLLQRVAHHRDSGGVRHSVLHGRCRPVPAPHQRMAPRRPRQQRWRQQRRQAPHHEAHRTVRGCGRRCHSDGSVWRTVTVVISAVDGTGGSSTGGSGGCGESADVRRVDAPRAQRAPPSRAVRKLRAYRRRASLAAAPAAER